MNLSYLTGRLVKSGPTKVGFVIIRFHPKRLVSYRSVLETGDWDTLLRSLLSGLHNLKHLLLSNTPDLW